MDWIRGEKLGHGSFATVSLAMSSGRSCILPPLMAVKSCEFSLSNSLMREKLILDELKDCPEIIQCFGETFSFENGEKLYNILLEYAPGGDLSENLKNFGDRRLPEFEVRRYTKALLKGLNYIHKFGYVHCDIKLQNILLGENGAVKIADFGLAKRVGASERAGSGCELRGTPLYMSPEMVAGGDQGPPADIWALGCVVAEMYGGSPAWRCSDVAGLLMRIGVGEELPEIPGDLSSDGTDFLSRCFVKDPSKRWTAEMLLDHPFICDQDFEDERLKDQKEYSPRCPFDFPDWVSCSITSLPSPEYSTESRPWSISPAERLRGIVSGQSQSHGWPVSDDWVTVRTE
ncbi:hypothetical protein BUALT_Bualt16G0035400 [Buddleja alternifolia]|uniref:Protein kinase domain-containing protein n=1 Tax=Buddleja alternifolia TaxID=168488 RepID=A0AAV6W8X3_9LAMI|nr:hypothetical protein BUALT_Bualt16G0035400 [Buddleja alternifolia]